MSDDDYNVIVNELKHINASLKRIESIEDRVSSLEKWKYGLVVGVGVLAVTKWPILGQLLSAFGG